MSKKSLFSSITLPVTLLGCAVILTGCVPENYQSHTYYGESHYGAPQSPAPVIVREQRVYTTPPVHNVHTMHVNYENRRLQREALQLERARLAEEARANAARERRYQEREFRREQRRNQRHQQQLDLELQRQAAQQQAQIAAQQRAQQRAQVRAQQRAQQLAQQRAARQAQLRAQQQQRIQAEQNRQAAFERANQKRLNDERRRLAEINARQSRVRAQQNAAAAGNTPLASQGFKDELAAAAAARRARLGQ